jgi:hypothetical protein
VTVYESGTGGKARHDKMVGMVETVTTADGLQPTAHGPDGNEMRIAKDLPKAEPSVTAGGSLSPARATRRLAASCNRARLILC